MQASDNRENKDNSHEAHPSLGNALESTFTTEYGEVRFDSCKAPEEHMRCLAEWIKDAERDAVSSHATDRAYFQGQIAGFKLAMELLAGQILESDCGIPF